MKNKHTPGPWKWDFDPQAHMHVLTPGVLRTYLTCGTIHGGSVDRKNALLIAAAPDLLEALEEAVFLLDKHVAGNAFSDDISPLVRQTLKHLNRSKEIIKKARGE